MVIGGGRLSLGAASPTGGFGKAAEEVRRRRSSASGSVSRTGISHISHAGGEKAGAMVLASPGGVSGVAEDARVTRLHKLLASADAAARRCRTERDVAHSQLSGTTELLKARKETESSLKLQLRLARDRTGGGGNDGGNDAGKEGSNGEVVESADGGPSLRATNLELNLKVDSEQDRVRVLEEQLGALESGGLEAAREEAVALRAELCEAIVAWEATRGEMERDGIAARAEADAAKAEARAARAEVAAAKAAQAQAEEAAEAAVAGRERAEELLVQGLAKSKAHMTTLTNEYEGVLTELHLPPCLTFSHLLPPFLTFPHLLSPSEGVLTELATMVDKDGGDGSGGSARGEGGADANERRSSHSVEVAMRLQGEVCRASRTSEALHCLLYAVANRTPEALHCPLYVIASHPRAVNFCVSCPMALTWSPARACSLRSCV